ncbi:hypothetical protein Taro_022658 [Colocasia esculenta]|uniref:Uncharacterized protein n=1 Tax=Colocasia esculenta TaxID=4460 RepID=A0A843V2I0_COLES|nr:hypothetical protein [Colocasia esculenta]
MLNPNWESHYKKIRI